MITNISLTTKERYLLEDARSHEEQCVLKYSNYEKLATDTELKAVFRTNGQKEQEHLETINQLLTGKVPSMSNSQSGGTQQQQQQKQSQQSPQAQRNTSQQVGGATGFNASDKDLCTDMLNTEKYVSHTYDTAIFEFKDAPVRDVLNHIQKEEQKHGEAIFMYMTSKGMYQPK
ncbi:MAG: hypothetical protein K0S76_280 [Herbinix sp.]|jgi:spore coat protein CotF|nr:hypothetical protein [Herbinix sp.]